MNKKIIRQKGMASIMFAMFIAIVISLIAIGFAVLVRNDQRQTLDKKLSNQAQYAAESAINKKQTEMQELKANNQPLTSNTTCNPSPIVLDSRMPDVKVTCLTWNPNPASLSFTNVNTRPRMTKIVASSPNNYAINSIVVNWGKHGVAGTASVGSDTSLSLSADFPTLRITIAQENNIAGAYTVFAIPGGSDSGGEVRLTGGGGSGVGNGALGRAECVGENNCKIIIDHLPDTWNSAQGYGYISISSLNGNSDVTITATSANNEGGNAVTFTDGQIEIDSTAMAQDVIKRLVAKVPILADTWRPGFALMADKLCKDYKLDAGNNIEQVLTHGKCPD